MIGKVLKCGMTLFGSRKLTQSFSDLIRPKLSNIDDVRSIIGNAFPKKILELDSSTQAYLENEVLRRGDDGLLEHIIDYSEQQSKRDKRLFGVHALAVGVQYRRLFKLIGRCGTARANAEQIYKTYGSPTARRRLEEDAGKYAGLDRDWKVLVWISAPDMRLKAAGVLVNDGHRVTRLVDLDGAGSKRGQEIYEAHRALWAISVFTHPSVTREQRAVVLARLGESLGGIKWDNLSEQPSVARLAAANAGKILKLPRQDEDNLALEAEGIAARGGGGTYNDLVRQVHQIAEARLPKNDEVP